MITEKMAKKREGSIILDNIRSVHNVGSIFRTAETLGISKIYCIGTTPTPTDRFGNKRTDFAKVALGAEDFVDWEYIANDKVEALIKKLKNAGNSIIALEQDSQSVDYKKVSVKGPITVIVGNEVEGVSRTLLDAAHVIAEIPMHGKKESLNVSVSAGIFLFRLFDY